MTKKISLLKLKRLKTTNQNNRYNICCLLFVMLIALAIIGDMGFAKAEGGANLNAQVMPKKITDTINDFDYSSLGAQNTPTPAKTVKGTTTHKDTRNNIFSRAFNKVIGFIKNIF